MKARLQSGLPLTPTSSSYPVHPNFSSNNNNNNNNNKNINTNFPTSPNSNPPHLLSTKEIAAIQTLTRQINEEAHQFTSSTYPDYRV